MAEEIKDSDKSYLPRSWGGRNSHKDEKTSGPHQSPVTPDSMANGSHEESGVDSVPSGYGDIYVQEPNVSLVATDPCLMIEDIEEQFEDSLETGDLVDACDDLITSLDPEPNHPFLESSDEAPKNTFSSRTIRVTGIRFGYACKVYHFDAGDMALAHGDWVVVKTEKGLGLGQVAVPPFEKEIDSTQAEALRKIIRKGGKVDVDQKERCCQRESEAYAYCLDKIEELGLPMKLVSVECFFDCSKYVFYFTSEGRVDFRELVKLLVSRFPVRIEMRQIGVRHEAKMTGGIACCGQELCCSRFLTDFRPVSVKMAKNQNLSLNPTKISGVCGRLMCCLSYEHDIYEDFSRNLPKVGKLVATSKGEGCVIKHNPLEETLLIKLADDTTIDVRPEDILGELEPDSPKKNSLNNPPVPKASKKNHSKKRQADPVCEEN
ncbi:MAG: PSP1 domain-containing protein [Desulfomonilaceae bacterium]